MQLKSLEIAGFKSFPEKTLISFSDGITAIVGPNGSGKSNIADALRWVMGETSSKSLRGVKMEDVIFDGTQDRRPLGYADVSLVLDNSDGTLPVEFAEVEIARRYYRSGESEYFINRQNVRLKDIHDLFRDTGLGKTGYSIIGQGSVADIINAKSSDRRSIFEEAAGIAKYKYKKEESEKKLALTQENILRLNDIIGELESRLGPLEQQAKKARRYIELYDEKKVLETAIWLDDIEKAAENLKKTEQDAEAVQASIDAADGGILNCENKLERLTADIQAITVEIERLRGESREFDEKIRAVESSILLLDNDSEHVKKDSERIFGEIEECKRASDDVDGEIEARKAQIRELEEKTARSLEETEKINLEKAERSDADAEYIGQRDALTEKAAEINKEITALQIREGRNEQFLQNIDEQTQNAQKELSDSDERLRSLEKSLENIKAEAEENVSKTDSLKNTLDGYNLKIKNRRSRHEALTKDYNDIKLALSEKASRKTMLEDMEKHYEGFAGSVKSIMNEAARGVLGGVCGTVASVIGVEEKYAVAVEIALGAALQNIITEDERSAKDCIYFLKTRNLGRATFLPVSTISGKRLDTSRLVGTEGYVGLACDLVSFDEKYTKVIEQLLGRTVIAESIDDATAIAKRNNYSFKIVTLDGQVVNPGGSLTGGSIGKNTGILSRQNEIEKLKTAVAEQSELLEKKAAELKACTQEVNSLQAYLDSALAENKLLDEERVRLAAEKNHCEEYIKNIKEQAETFRQILENSQAQQENAKNDLEAARKELAERFTALDETEKRLEEISKLHAEMSRIQDEINERLHKKELERLEFIKTADNISENIKILLERKESGQALIESKQAQIMQNDAILAEYAEKIAAEKQRAEALRAEYDETAAAIDAKNAERTKAEAEKNRIYEDEKKYFDQKDKLGREAERLAIRIGTLKNERETIISKIWDEYEMTLSEAKEAAIGLEDPEAAKKRVTELRNSIKALGNVNVDAIEEFAEVKQRYDTLAAQINDLTEAKAALERIIAGLVGEMTGVFGEKFKKINEEFSKTFRELFNGGTAKLTLTEPDDILTSGVEIYVAPPGKVIKNLSALSGGEQALTAIALYFALLKVRPSPFCLLDEIESALDDVNVVRFAQYLRNLSQKTQFLCITHRRGTMESADRLYGVTMREKGISKILAINVSEIEKGYV